MQWQHGIEVVAFLVIITSGFSRVVSAIKSNAFDTAVHIGDVRRLMERLADEAAANTDLEPIKYLLQDILENNEKARAVLEKMSEEMAAIKAVSERIDESASWLQPTFEMTEKLRAEFEGFSRKFEEFEFFLSKHLS
jgi:hypothetical protein